MALSSLLLLGGCGAIPSSQNLLGFITPYHVEVVQGNVVTREQAAQIKPGMSKAQVRDVLGSPLLTDPFHADRWDYVFTIRRQGTTPQSRALVVVFEGDLLKTVEASGELPAEREFVASIDASKPPRRTSPLTLTEEQLKALPPPRPQAPAEAVPDVAARSYPPLEPSAP
jgi:outer membrane protein assembly factor BamE